MSLTLIPGMLLSVVSKTFLGVDEWILSASRSSSGDLSTATMGPARGRACGVSYDTRHPVVYHGEWVVFIEFIGGDVLNSRVLVLTRHGIGWLFLKEIEEYEPAKIH